MPYLDSLFSVSGKTALVTGGATGIGRMMAEALVMAGAKVMICSRKADACEAVAAQLNELDAPGSAEGYGADLGSGEGVLAAAAEVRKRTDKLHILMNNAGATWGEEFEKFPRKAWDKIMNVNVTSIFELTRDLTPLLEAAATDDDPARVINVASVMGIVPVAGGAYSYSVSKAAVIHLTKILANEFTKRRITVNAFAPGPFPVEDDSLCDGDRAGRGSHRPDEPDGPHRPARRHCRRHTFPVRLWRLYVTGTTIPLDGGYVVDTGDAISFRNWDNRIWQTRSHSTTTRRRPMASRAIPNGS